MDVPKIIAEIAKIGEAIKPRLRVSEAMAEDMARAYGIDKDLLFQEPMSTAEAFQAAKEWERQRRESGGWLKNFPITRAIPTPNTRWPDTPDDAVYFPDGSMKFEPHMDRDLSTPIAIIYWDERLHADEPRPRLTIDYDIPREWIKVPEWKHEADGNYSVDLSRYNLNTNGYFYIKGENAK